MKIKTKLLWIGIGVLITACIASGWIYSSVQRNQTVQDAEIAELNSSFQKQYGNIGITFNQLVTSERIWAASGTDSYGIKYVFVNIAGVWGVWWQSDIPEEDASTAERP